MPLNVPNLLTWLRILTIPLVIGVFYVPGVWLSSWHQNLIATSLFIAAAITDAVHHATGVRVRELPITLDKLL